MKCFKFKLLLILLFIFASLLLCSSNCFSFFDITYCEEELGCYRTYEKNSKNYISLEIGQGEAAKIKLDTKVTGIKISKDSDPQKVLNMYSWYYGNFFLSLVEEDGDTYLYILIPKPFRTNDFGINRFREFYFYYGAEEITLNLCVDRNHNITAYGVSEIEKAGQRYAYDENGNLISWWVSGDKCLLRFGAYCTCERHVFEKIDFQYRGNIDDGSGTLKNTMLHNHYSSSIEYLSSPKSYAYKIGKDNSNQIFYYITANINSDGRTYRIL